MKKKFLSGILAAVMVLGLSACGGGETGSASSAQQAASGSAASSSGTSEADGETAAAGEKFKIGFSYFSATDPYGALMIQNLEQACAATGCELVFDEWPGGDTTAMQDSVQNLIEKGCDGIVGVYMSPAILAACEKADVSFVLSHGAITDENLLEMAGESPVFAGQVVADDYQSGKDEVQALMDAGCTRIAYVGPQAGMAPQKDECLRGFQDACEELGITDAVIYQGEDYSTDALLQLITTYPEVDGYSLATGAQVPTIYNEGLENKLKVATVDISKDVAVQGIEDGVIAYYAGNEASAAIINMSFSILYNNLTGNDLIPDKKECFVIPYVGIKTSEDLENYDKYFNNSEVPVYTDEEIRSMLVAFNPDATYETIAEMAENSTLEGTMARHGDLIK